MMEGNKRVLLGMSGGMDSSVAVIRLLETGYEVTGVTFRSYELNDSTEYLEDVRHLAERLGIHHIMYGAREIFRKQIIEYFVYEYMVGHTPVPYTLCNNYLKWPLLSKIADEMGIFYVATGHYVRKVKVGDTCYITYAADSDKGQTFFLWGLRQDTLRRMLLPMGDTTKVEARAFAAKQGPQKVAAKRDSLGVCFCPMDYRSSLKTQLVSDCQPQANVGQPQVSVGQTWSTEVRRGRFVDEKGDFITWHEGCPFYTVGQRRGLGIHLNRAAFVKEIHPEKNEVVLTPLQTLEKAEILLKDWNIVNQGRLLGHADITVKICYREQENHHTVTVTLDNFPRVQLREPLATTASRQAAAFYKGSLLLGGGVIVG